MKKKEVRVGVFIEGVPIKAFSKREIDFYFKSKLARGLCYKISSFLSKSSSVRGKGAQSGKAS